jgi:hypothetical protein
MASMTPKQRSEHMRHAVKSRWSKPKIEEIAS